MIPYENCKIYGPYLRKDGRQHIVAVNGNKKITISYPKYLVELREDRYLLNNETVDHNDRDFTNNESSNLIIRDRKVHIKLDAIRIKSQKGNCPNCGKEVIIKSLAEQRRGKAIGFCSKKCSSKYGRKLQLGLVNKITTTYKEMYTTLKN